MPLVNTALTLKDLPPAPEGKTGWPWTEQSEPLPDKMADGSDWPRISIVTPNYNYGQFIEETIRSVLLQGYPNLEYIVIDGGSTDNSVEIIKKYEKWLSYWVSEKDNGQTDAINKGYSFCTGDLFVWLNSDDAYTQSDCLKSVAKLYSNGYNFIVGECIMVDEKDKQDIKRQQYGESRSVNFNQYLKFWKYPSLPQPAVFISRELVSKSFPLDMNLYMVMDYQLFLRVLKQKPKSIWVRQKWVKFKCHGNNKTMGNHPNEFDGFKEIYNLVLLESKNLDPIHQKIYQIELLNYKSIYNLTHQKHLPSFYQIIQSYQENWLLFYWPIFWKILFKSLLGEGWYSYIKNLNIKNLNKKL